MIVPMKKISVILSSDFVDEDMESLQHLGVVDIDANHKFVEPDDITLQKFNIISKSIETLTRYSDVSADVQLEYDQDVYELAAKINVINKEIDTLKKQEENLQIQKLIAVKFGNVSINNVKDFKQNNLQLHVYEAPAKQKHPFPKNKKKNKKRKNDVIDDDVFVHTSCFYKTKEKSYWSVFVFNNFTANSYDTEDTSKAFVVPITWTGIKLPEQTSVVINKGLVKIEKQLSLNRKKLESYGYTKSMLVSVKTKLFDELSKIAVLNNGYQKDGIILLEGYIPAESVVEVLSNAVEKSWGIVIDDPDKNDENIPTAIKNIAPVRLIKPLFQFLDIDPGYREFDISAIFLFFMSLFVAMIIGDAGYGVIILLLSLGFTFSTLKNKKDLTALHAMFIWFSIVTIMWGSITGNWFGYIPFAQNTVLSFLVIPQFAFFNPESKEVIQLFAFRVGITQLLLAHMLRCIRVFRTKGILSSVHELAQMSMLSGLFLLVLQLLLGADKFPVPPYGLQLIAGGIIVKVLTSEQKRRQNIFIGMVKGISNIITIALDSVAAFADIISYVRLYAVGLASLAIATSFNAMGQAIMEAGGVVAISGGIATIVLGHSLNLVMAILAVVVHGVRLNVLEFSGHLGMEWAGRKYTPFRKEKKIVLRRI